MWRSTVPRNCVSFQIGGVAHTNYWNPSKLLTGVFYWVEFSAECDMNIHEFSILSWDSKLGWNSWSEWSFPVITFPMSMQRTNSALQSLIDIPLFLELIDGCWCEKHAYLRDPSLVSLQGSLQFLPADVSGLP